MKKFFLFIFFITSCYASSIAQNPTYQEKLYYTCKVWGFTKYYHTQVSNCLVNWDSVLVSYLPAVKSAVTTNDFNTVLANMLAAAGPMQLAVTYFPDNLPAELKRNRNWGWVHDPGLRADIQVILDTIKNNFRPHPNCMVLDNDYTNPNYRSYLVFPQDSLMIDDNFYTNYPDEWHRLLVAFKHWNIINYFNPYNYALDKPADSTLYNNIEYIADAQDYPTFVRTFKKMTGALDDAHTEGLTWTNYYLFPGFYTLPLVLRYMDNKYVVVKSGMGINVGDEIVSVDGLSTQQWEDSLVSYVSSGNLSVFRREMCRYLLAGNYNTGASIVYKDANGTDHSTSAGRSHSPYEPFYDYYPNDTLANTTWTTLDCGVGYANIGNLSLAGADSMYDALSASPAMIIDIRNYPISGSVWQLADRMYANPTNFSRLSIPDVNYPGTFWWEHPGLGINNNPTPYNGKIIILFNQETQSAAEYDCMILEAMPDVVKIGSQTAGADGNVSYYKVSQDLHVGYTNLGVYYPNGDSTQRIGIVPDIVVTPTQAGIRQGRDEVLEKAIEVACAAMPVANVNANTAPVRIAPNPATDMVNVDLNNVSAATAVVSISDMTGKLVLQKDIAGNGQSVHASLDIRALAPGMYILNVKAGSVNSVTKLVKQ